MAQLNLPVNVYNWMVDFFNGHCVIVIVILIYLLTLHISIFLRIDSEERMVFLFCPSVTSLHCWLQLSVARYREDYHEDVIELVSGSNKICRHHQLVRWTRDVDVEQPSTDHQLIIVQCVRVCVLLCLVFIIAVHLGNKVIFYPLSPLTS